jgi:hypothetical protein
LIGFGIILVTLIIVGAGSSNLPDDELEDNPKAQAIANEWSAQVNVLLGICRPIDTSKDTLEGLQKCKTQFQTIQNDCKEKLTADTDFCSNTDFQKLDESFDQRIIMVEEKVAKQKPVPKQDIEVGFSGTNCSQDIYGQIKITGKYTNGNTPYENIVLTLGVIGEDDSVVATGLGFIKDIGAYETKIFYATALYPGSFKSCEIEISSAYEY